jgi:hypothetical protein
MAIETCFAKKVAWFQDSYDCFLAPLGNDRELDLAALDVKDRVRNVTLAENNLVENAPAGRSVPARGEAFYCKGEG